MHEQPGGERRARPVLDHSLACANDLELAEEAGRGCPDHRLQALKQAAPAASPVLAAIMAAVEASISNFCWTAEHPASAQSTARNWNIL
jgi:hypothetical protein